VAREGAREESGILARSAGRVRRMVRTGRAAGGNLLQLRNQEINGVQQCIRDLRAEGHAPFTQRTHEILGSVQHARNLGKIKQTRVALQAVYAPKQSVQLLTVRRGPLQPQHGFAHGLYEFMRLGQELPQQLRHGCLSPSSSRT